MKRYYKEINGEKVWFDGILNSNKMQIINPSEKMIADEGWIEYISPTIPQPTEELLLTLAIKIKLTELYNYDESSLVNNCVIIYDELEFDFWKDKHERDALKSAVNDYITVGRTEYRLDLRELGVCFYISCKTLLEMLAQLEVYATDCYNKTTDHEFAIKSFTSVQEVEQYEFRGVGYPDKLIFNIDQ